MNLFIISSALDLNPIQKAKKSIIRSFGIIVLILLNLLTSCSHPKSHFSHGLDLPCEWNSPSSTGMNANSPSCVVWWETLNDPNLNRLMKQAAFQNLDLYLAGTRILETRLQKKAKKSDLYPHLDMSLSSSHLDCHRNVVLNKILNNCDKKNKRDKFNLSLFEIGFDADWEFDLFNVNQYETRALEAQTEASEENFNDVWVRLSAEIGRNYIELRYLQNKLVLLNQQIESQEDVFSLTEELLRIGIVGSIDVSNVIQELASLKSQKPFIELLIQKSIYRLSTLLGQNPGELENLTQLSSLPCLPNEQPIGVPSELLIRRPDIRRAEKQWSVAKERVGGAEVAIFPKFSLRGFVGILTTQLKSLFNPMQAGAWLINPQLLMPVFNSRILKQDVDYQKLKAQQALFEYKKTVLEALEESENAIATFHYELEKGKELLKAQKAAQEAQVMTLELYQRGFKSYLEVQRANQSLCKAEERLLENQAQVLIHYIALYKALGGEWNSKSDLEDNCSDTEEDELSKFVNFN